MFTFGPALFGANASGDPYFSSVSSLLHLDGADNGIVFPDSKSLVWTPSGNAKTSTARSKFGGASYLGDGTGDFISTPDTVPLQMGASDFTFECFFWLAAGGAFQGFYSKRTANSQFSEFAVYVDTSNRVNFNASNNGTSWTTAIVGPVVSLSAWHHVAATRLGNVFTVWLDGVSGGTATVAGALTTATSPSVIGALSSAGEFSLNGNIDEVRITKGVARYTANFTPPTAACPDS